MNQLTQVIWIELEKSPSKFNSVMVSVLGINSTATARYKILWASRMRTTIERMTSLSFFRTQMSILGLCIMMGTRLDSVSYMTHFESSIVVESCNRFSHVIDFDFLF